MPSLRTHRATMTARASSTSNVALRSRRAAGTHPDAHGSGRAMGYTQRRQPPPRMAIMASRNSVVAAIRTVSRTLSFMDSTPPLFDPSQPNSKIFYAASARRTAVATGTGPREVSTTASRRIGFTFVYCAVSHGTGKRHRHFRHQ